MKQKQLVCDTCGQLIEKRKGHKHLKWRPVNKAMDAVELTVPFYCQKCGSIKSPFKPLHNFVFIYPLVNPIIPRETFLILPEPDEVTYSDFGIILAFGPGYYDKKKFNPTPRELKVGMKVIYDKTVPWEVWWEGQDGLRHLVKYMPALDVKLIPLKNDSEVGADSSLFVA